MPPGDRKLAALRKRGIVTKDGRLDPLHVRDRSFDFIRAIQRTQRDDSTPPDGQIDNPTRMVSSLAKDVWTAAVTWLRHNSRRAILFGVVGSAIGWLLNIVIMARRYEGFFVPSGGAATGKGNLFWGSAIWLLGSVVVSSVIGYRLSVGRERFWQEVRTFPSSMQDLFRRDGDRAWTHMLWGFAGTMLVVLVLAPSFSGWMAVGIIVLLGSALRPLVTGTVLAVWRELAKRFFPDRPARPEIHSLVVASMGTAVAFAVGFFVVAVTTRVLVGLLAAGVAYLIAQQRGKGQGPSPTSAAGLILLVTLGAVVAGAQAAFADDGGWAECGSSLARWLSCGGTAEVWLRAMAGGTVTGLGSALGSGLGSSDGEAGPDGKPWSEMTDHEKRKALIHHFRDKHPDASLEEINQMVDTFMAAASAGPPEEDFWEKAQRLWEQAKAEGRLLTSEEFWRAFGNEYWEDLASGKQGQRILDTLKAMWDAPDKMLEGLWDTGGALWENRDKLIQAGMDWIVNTSPEDMLAQLGELPGNISAAILEDYKTQLAELAQASLNGDDAKVSQIIGQLAGEEMFGVLLGAGIGKAIEGGAGYLSTVSRHTDDLPGPKGPDVDGPRKPGSDPDGDGGGPGKGPDGDSDRHWTEDVDPYSRPPMTVAEIEAEFANLKPGERIRLTPEEAAAWGGYEKQMLIQSRENSLLYGTETDAGERPWVELKRGNQDALELREGGYVDADGNSHSYNPKPNHIKDKSLEANEMYFVPDYYKDGFTPGEVVSFEPTRIPEVGEKLPNGQIVDQDLVDRLESRVEQTGTAMQGQATKQGPVIDRYGKQVLGESRLTDTGHWETRQYTHDANGLHPSDPNYVPTWSDWDRVAGDSDTFAIGSGSELMPGVSATSGGQTIVGYKADGTPIMSYEMTEAERLAYAASDGTVPGEGNTPIRYTPETAPDFDQGKYDSTINKATNEGVVLVDADGYYLTAPGTHY